MLYSCCSRSSAIHCERSPERLKHEARNSFAFSLNFSQRKNIKKMFSIFFHHLNEWKVLASFFGISDLCYHAKWHLPKAPRATCWKKKKNSPSGWEKTRKLSGTFHRLIRISRAKEKLFARPRDIFMLMSKNVISVVKCQPNNISRRPKEEKLLIINLGFSRIESGIFLFSKSAGKDAR